MNVLLGTGSNVANKRGTLPAQNTGSCPPLHDAIVEHHVILRHGDCEM